MPAIFLAVPVNTKVEYHRAQPGTQFCRSGWIELEQPLEAVFTQFFTNIKKAVVTALLLELNLSYDAHDERRVVIDEFGPGSPGIRRIEAMKQFADFSLVGRALCHTSHMSKPTY